MKKLIVYMAHDRDNGKCYFGSTFQSLEKRIKQHQYYAKKNKTKGHFYAALAKRPERFFWIVLSEEFSESRQAEEELLKKFCKMDWCYNQKDTANGAGKGLLNCGQSPQTIEKRKKKYRESIKRGDHLFQDPDFKENNKKRQTQLIKEKTHNFSKSQGKGVNNAYSNKALWKRYDKLFQIWLYYEKPREYKFSKILGYKKSSFSRMIESFFKDIV